jgi:hypothetical protein
MQTDISAVDIENMTDCIEVEDPNRMGMCCLKKPLIKIDIRAFNSTAFL